ncbi:MAG: 6-bladed beta-propeller [Peptococcaceae bacterium]|nr:6-bladed beta-propeller [Peptococcaceae bacterium]
MPGAMSTTTGASPTPLQKGISKTKFNIALTLAALLLIAIFLFTYFTGRNVFKPVTQALTFNPGPPAYIYSIYGEGAEGQLKKPMGVTVANSRIYVADTSNQRVQVFDYNGKALFKFGKDGKGAGQFQFPYGIAADSNDHIYVADMWANNIQEFTSDGKFVKYFARDKQGKSEIGKPTGLCIVNGKLYEADLKSNSVKVFDIATEKKVQEIGKEGKGAGQFVAPNSVVVTADKIYVGDSQNDRLEAFSPDGKFLYSMNGADNSASTNSKTITVRGIGVDSRGVVYGASMLGNYVCGFDSKGKYLWTFGGQGMEDGQFILPNGLFVDSQGRIYVTDEGNNRVSVWEN